MLIRYGFRFEEKGDNWMGYYQDGSSGATQIALLNPIYNSAAGSIVMPHLLYYAGCFGWNHVQTTSQGQEVYYFEYGILSVIPSAVNPSKPSGHSLCGLQK